MRSFTLCTFALLGTGLAMAADGPKEFTYLSGTVSDLSATSGGTLSYSDGKNVELKTPLHRIMIPYAAISSVELGEIHSPAPEPIYKVWSLHKRLSNKGDTQEMTIAFKDDAGREQAVTLELAKQEASDLLADIRDRNDPSGGDIAGDTSQDWWGNRVWKTARNGNEWIRK